MNQAEIKSLEALIRRMSKRIGRSQGIGSDSEASACPDEEKALRRQLKCELKQGIKKVMGPDGTKKEKKVKKDKQEKATTETKRGGSASASGVHDGP